jgi:hypothetical protein
MSMDDWMKLVDAWIAEGRAWSYDDALGIDSGTTSSWPQRSNQDLGSENTFLDDGLKLIDAWIAGRQARPSNDALGINSGWPERKNQYLGSENGFLADCQAQTPSATGVWSNGAFNITHEMEMIPGRTTPQEEQGRRVIVAEPGSQAPGVTVNGVALRHPPAKLPLGSFKVATYWPLKSLLIGYLFVFYCQSTNKWM